MAKAERVRVLLTVILALLQPLAAAMAPLAGIGRPIAEMVATATPAVPAGYAFLIWWVIFALSIAWAGWQALPAGRGTALAQRAGWPLAGMMGCDVGWMLLVQLAGDGWLAVLLVFAALGSALVALWLAAGVVAPRAGRWIAVALAGISAGWLTAAAFVNVASVAVLQGAAPTLMSLLVLLAAGGFAAGVAAVLRGEAWYVGGVAWALAAVVLANLGLRALNLVVAVAAAAMLALVVLVAWQRRRRAVAETGVAAG